MQNKLPGDKNFDQIFQEIIRVNHAGEYGAKRIYEGQLRILKDTDIGPLIQEMQDHELEHLEYFEKKIVDYQVRPTILHPLWHVFGYALGVVTALGGAASAMACTEAVEEVISEHYKEQIDSLPEGELKDKIIKFRNDEIDHQNIAINHNVANANSYPVLNNMVKFGCRIAIYLSKRF